jgi:hypothetical protein
MVIIAPMERRLIAVCLTAVALVGFGCLRGDLGQPTDQEITQMQAWSEVVTPQDREQVTREANQHTDWLERRKVQFITGEYKRRYLHQQSHPSTARSATTTTSAPSGGMAPTGL